MQIMSGPSFHNFYVPYQTGESLLSVGMVRKKRHLCQQTADLHMSRRPKGGEEVTQRLNPRRPYLSECIPRYHLTYLDYVRRSTNLEFHSSQPTIIQFKFAVQVQRAGSLNRESRNL